MPSVVRLLLLSAALTLPAAAAPPAPQSHLGDPHYTPVGFFDIHVCHWPDQPPLFLMLFSTTRFEELSSVEVVRPDGVSLGMLKPERYRVVRKPNKPEKRVFMTTIPVPDGSPNGWYVGRVTMKNGDHFEGKDYVVHELMTLPTGLQPAEEAKDVPLAPVFNWSAVPGAKFYKVFVYDLWDDEKTVYQSKLLTETRHQLPPGILKPDGYYAWMVHAREGDEHPLLGDFNHGSLSRRVHFTTVP